MALAADVASGRDGGCGRGRLKSLSLAKSLFSPLALSPILRQFDAMLDLLSPSGSIRSLCLKLCWVKATCLEVLLVDILVAQGWPLSCGELSIQDVRGDVAILHSAHVS